MTRILEKAAQERDADLEAWETALRAAVLAAGAKALGALLEGIGSGRRQTPLLCPCGTPMQREATLHHSRSGGIPAVQVCLPRLPTQMLSGR